MRTIYALHKANTSCVFRAYHHSGTHACSTQFTFTGAALDENVKTLLDVL